jgi:hypothetical protein
MPSVRSDVVVNTGPVLALAAAGYLHVLRDLFNDVIAERKHLEREMATRVLDALDPRPALIRTATWDVLAEPGSAAMLTDCGSLPPKQ